MRWWCVAIIDNFVSLNRTIWWYVVYRTWCERLDLFLFVNWCVDGGRCNVYICNIYLPLEKWNNPIIEMCESIFKYKYSTTWWSIERVNPNQTILRDNETHVEYLYLETFGYELGGDELERFFSSLSIIFDRRMRIEKRCSKFDKTRISFYLSQQYCTKWAIQQPQ